MLIENLVSFVTSRLPVDVMFLPKCISVSGASGRFVGLGAFGSNPVTDQLLRRRWGRCLNCPDGHPEAPVRGRQDGDGTTDALAPSPLYLRARLRFKDRFSAMRNKRSCSSACTTAYQQRLVPETKVKICQLDVLPWEDQINGSNAHR
jgi:hypothetical protein